jgi:hypothetical protein
LALSFPVEAEQQAKIPKIGWLGARPAATAAEQRELFWREFRALGYVESKNITFEYRSLIISSIASLRWPMSWFVTRLMCS